MKVLQLGKFYDPVVGGMETALKDICESLTDQVEFQVIVANTRPRTEHENGKVPTHPRRQLGKMSLLTCCTVFSALGAKVRCRSDPRSSGQSAG